MVKEAQNELSKPQASNEPRQELLALLDEIDVGEFLEDPEEKERIKDDTKQGLDELKKEVEKEEVEEGLDASVSQFERLLRDIPSNRVIFTDEKGKLVHGPIKIPDRIYRLRLRASREAFLTDWKKRKKHFAKKPLLWEYRVWKRDKKRQYEQALAKWVDSERKRLKRRSIGKITYPEAYVGKSRSNEFLWKGGNSPISKENAETRVSYITRVLNESILPQDWHADILALVAHESAFQDKALSQKGARGAWQFMPKTARRFGLRVKEETIKGKKVLAKEWFTDQNETRKEWKRKWKWVYKPATREIDDRTNFEKATHAGIAYFEFFYKTVPDSKDVKRLVLEYNVDQNDLSKYLVLNAYNAGEGLILNMCKWFLTNFSPDRVEKSLAYKPDAGDLFHFMVYRFTEYQKSRFKREQRDYVPSILALKNLAPEGAFEEKGPLAMR